MRRAAKLFDRIYELENLRNAFHKAARGRRGQAEVQQFASGLDARLADMSLRIRDGTITIGRFHQFMIRDPKERVITAPCFEERVFHHAIMNVCEPILDRWLIDDTFACRVGKGRESAILRAQQFARHNDWFLKLDVRKYFDSVSHRHLIALLKRRFKDKRLLGLLSEIIEAYRGELAVGLPIGSLTSQHFANFFLGWFDRYVKETLRVHGYVRYMDDMVLWHTDRDTLFELHTQCETFVSRTLALEFKPAVLRRMGSGVPFLGCRIFPTHVELNRRSKLRWRARVRALERAERLRLISEMELQTRLTALTAFATGAGVKSWRFRDIVLQQMAVNDPKGLESREPWRQLEQRRG